MLRSVFFIIAYVGLGLSTCFSQESLEISLLTCSPGKEIYSTFGHSAIRVKDSVKGIDDVYDYGTFNFNTPNFALKFMRGQLKYSLSKGSFSHFLKRYKAEKKGVFEEKLNLTQKDKALFYTLLKNNYKSENRYYYYNFFFDNCSTRIRDLIEQLHNVAYSKTSPTTGKTFNDGLNEFFTHKPWLGLGINLVLGQTADNVMTKRNHMFLPKHLSKNLSAYTNTLNGKSILESPKALLNDKQNITPQSFSVTPLLCFVLLLVLVVITFFKDPKFLLTITPVIYFILGFIGVLLLFLWFGTSHHTTRLNWNVIWANPLYLLLAFVRHKKWSYYLLLVLSLLTLFVILGTPIIPQHISTAFLVLMVAILVINAKTLCKLINC